MPMIGIRRFSPKSSLTFPLSGTDQVFCDSHKGAFELLRVSMADY